MADRHEGWGKQAGALEYGLLMSSLDVSVSKHLLDEHFTLVEANDRYYQMFGYTKEEYEALYHNKCDLFYGRDPEDWNALVEYVAKEFAKGTKYDYVCRMRHKDGRRLWIKLIGNLTDETMDGIPVSYTVMMDITRQMQLQVEQTVTYNNFPGLIAKYKVTDDGYVFLNANQRYLEVFPEHDLTAPADQLNEGEKAQRRELFSRFRKGEPIKYAFSTTPPGYEEPIYLNEMAECVDWEGDSPVYLSIFPDVTEIKKQNDLLEKKNKELEYLAYTDPVTQGMNRNRFEQVAKEAVTHAPAGRYALVWLNLQKFKLINDLAGNARGDSTLRYIHNTIAPFLKEGEYIARTSADNYSLLLENDTDERIVGRLEEMARAINRFNDGVQYKYVLLFTAGIYRIDDPTLEITILQDRAHVARKGAGKNGGDLCTCSFYSEAEHQKLVAEKELENRMESALKHNEFVVYLQPKHSLKDERVAGAEALVRWQDPERGLIPPGAFIPTFEQNGFIIRLDHYVFEEVCKLLRRWLDQGFSPVPISVNMSRAHFTAPDFLGPYVDLCKKYRVPPELIEIEVTETIVFENPEGFMQIVSKIHEAGFSCSMDDFGSGYSSLNLLKDIKVDSLKLDRAFFNYGDMDDSRGRDVVTSVVELAKKLEMQTVAEGIEKRPQVEFLKSTDCDMVQGFVFGKPMPAREFEALAFGK